MSVVVFPVKKDTYCCQLGSWKGWGFPKRASCREMLASCSMGKLCCDKSGRSKEPASGLEDERRPRPPIATVKSGPMLRPAERPWARCGIVMARPSWWMKLWFARAGLGLVLSSIRRDLNLLFRAGHGERTAVWMGE